MEMSAVNLWITISVAFSAFHRTQSTSLRLRQALLASGNYLNDVDGDNIPGQAGVDYPVYASVPKGTSFRCRDYEYAGYFADVEADCQAYHVCFPDGRNASFLCVNGTVFHQRYFVCDWWFHSNCSVAPTLYDLNLFRKIPLPVLPPVQRRQFPGPAPQPGPAPLPPPPRNELTPVPPRAGPPGSRSGPPPPPPREKPFPPSIRTGSSPLSPGAGPSPPSIGVRPSLPSPGAGPSPPSNEVRPLPPSPEAGPSPPSTAVRPLTPSSGAGPSPPYTGVRSLPPSSRPGPPPPSTGVRPSTRTRPPSPSTRAEPPLQVPRGNPRDPKNIQLGPMNKELIQPRKSKDSNDLSPPDYDRKPEHKKPFPPIGDRHDEKCDCQCGSSPAAMYIASAIQYDDEHS